MSERSKALFLRRRLLKWSLRLLGWMLLVPCTAVVADLLNPHFSVGPLSGNGDGLVEAPVVSRRRLYAYEKPGDEAGEMGA